MACGQPTETLYDTLTTTTIGPIATLTTDSLSTSVISGAFPSSLCAESVGGQCVRSTLTTLVFTYTTVATNQVVLTTRPVFTTTQVVPTRTLFGSCVSASASQTTLPNGSVSISSVYITVSAGNGASSPDAPVEANGGSSNKGAIIGGAVAGVVALVIFIAVIWILWRRNRKMSKQIKQNEEEEKRNGAINVDQLLPSPYTQYPASFSATQGNSVYQTSNADAYRQSAASPGSGSHIISPTSQSYGGHMAAAGAVATQYTPTHSRDGSFSTQAPGRPPSTVPGGPDHSSLPISPLYPAQGSSNEPPAGASAKSREAFQHRRRSALYTQNAGEGEDDEDIVIPANATVVRSTVPPSAWGAPPPAYSPGD